MGDVGKEGRNEKDRQGLEETGLTGHGEDLTFNLSSGVGSKQGNDVIMFVT